ncbi:MAG: hypothetical protein RBR13_09575 [Tenuifilaceae bacterium]|nr:hypothetical protein [Tenuifilaceae bacterium]
MSMAQAVMAEAYRKKLARQALNGQAAPRAAFMAFGDGGLDGDRKARPFDAARNGLYHELIRKPLIQVQQEDLFSVTCTGRLERTDLVGFVISEAAVLDANGDPMGFKSFGGKDKEADEFIDVVIKIKY